jgi:hypothetical protein
VSAGLAASITLLWVRGAAGWSRIGHGPPNKVAALSLDLTAVTARDSRVIDIRRTHVGAFID